MQIHIHQLGCDKNRVDGEKLAARLANAGYEIVSLPENADVVLINTCGFINSAKEESINTILEFAKSKKVIVAGCLSERYSSDLKKELKEAGLIIGLCDSETSVAAIINKYPPKITRGCRSGHSKKRILGNSSHYAPIKISEGCSNNCSYCAIPIIRGKYIQRNENEILKEAQELKSQGVKELLIVAQDTTAYGNRKGLPKLLGKIANLPDPFMWIRLMYCHPLGVTDELIDTLADLPNLLHYIDMPIQHISDTILGRMNRHYNRNYIEKTIDKLRTRIPDITIRTTFLLGFPGETAKHFKELYNFCSAMQFDRMGAFAYSREDGTAASLLPESAAARTVKTRLEELMYLQNDIMHKKNVERIGTEPTVMVDEIAEELLLCRTKQDAPEVDCTAIVRGYSAKPGDLIKVKIKDAIGIDIYNWKQSR